MVYFWFGFQEYGKLNNYLWENKTKLPEADLNAITLPL